EVLIRVSDTFVMLLAVFVLFGIRRRITMFPEDRYELLSLVVGFEFLKSRTLSRRDDQGNIFFEPAREGIVRFRFDLARFFVRRLSLLNLIRLLCGHCLRRRSKTGRQEREDYQNKAQPGLFEHGRTPFERDT